MTIAGFRREQTAAPMPVELDPSQRAVVELPDGVSAAVLGAPGTGKTTTIVELVAERVLERGWSPESVFVLTSSRATATALRDRIAQRIGRPTAGPLARTVNSLAFELVADAAHAAGQPAPRLITGGEQDADIAGLIEGHLETGRGPSWPADLTPEVLRTRRFRTELRETLARATEYELAPDDLRGLADRHDRPEWAGVADFLEEYQSVIASSRPSQLDSAEFARFAVRALAAEDPSERVRDLRLVILDDAQDATQGTIAILRALAARGIAVIALGDPDVAVNAFRGGEPDVLGRLGAVLGLPGLPTLILTESHRQPAPLRALTSAITGRIGAATAGIHRNPSAGDPATDAAAAQVRVTTPAREWGAIARLLRERHLRDGVPWDQLAVIARSRAHVDTIRRALAHAEVPVRSPAFSSALRDDPAARGLLQVVEAGLGRVELTPAVAAELLTGPFGGLDPLELRRLRIALRTEEVAGGGRRTSDALLAEALTDPARLATIDHRVARRATRLAETLAAVRDSDGTIEELLWLVWERSGVARRWHDQALGNGLVADEANRNLDGVVALFTAAKRFAERRPSDAPILFLEAVLDADVPEDTLSPQPADASVLVTTPPGVAGLEFDTVVVAALQDGVWPNLRLRGSLLHPQELVRAVLGVEEESLDLRKLVRDDELRMFAMAVSRAKRRLVLAAVANDDEAPSPFFAVLPPLPELPAAKLEAMTLRAATARLRRLVVTGSPQERADAASTLAALARDQVDGADPDDWQGLLPPSTDRPLYDGEEEVPVSPSSLETVLESPLDWFVGRMSTAPSGMSANVGTLIHAAMETAEPHLDALWEVVENRWAELLFEAPWLAERQRRLARRFTEALAEYLGDFAARGHTLVSSELGFRLAIDRAVLAGKIDRIERTDQGEIVIVDLKTGRVATAKQVAEHPQLGAYQLAYADGELVEALAEIAEHRPGGAKLLFVKEGRGGRRYREELQPPFGPEQLEAFRESVRRAAILIAAASFTGEIEIDDFDFDVAAKRLIRTRAVSSD